MLATYRDKSWLQRYKVLVLLAYVAFVFAYGAAFALIGRFFLTFFTVPILLGIFGVIALLPVTDRAPNRALTPMLFAFILALCCWPDYLAISLPGLPWITLIRLIAFPLAILFLIDLSSSTAIRREINDAMRPNKAAYVCLIVFVILAALSIGLSKNPVQSMNKFIVLVSTCIVPLLIASWVFQRPGRAENFAKALLFVTIFVCLIAVQEVRHRQLPWAGHIPSFLAIQDEAVQRILAGSSRAGTNIYRAQSRFTTSLGLGEFLGLALPFILHLLFTRSSLLIRALCVLSLPLLVYVVIETDSRLAAIGMLASCMMYLLAWAVLRWRTREGSLFGPFITIAYPAIFTVFMASTFFVGRLRGMVWGDGSQDPSNEARKIMYREGFPMVLKNPLGYGWGMGARTLGYTNGAGTLTIDTYYLAIALELGVLGFLVYYGFFLLILAKSGLAVLNLKDRDALFLIPIAIAFVNFIISKSVFSNQENHPLVFVMAGIAIALLKRNADAEAEAQAQRRQALATV